MKRKHFSEEQIVEVPKQSDAGAKRDLRAHER